MHEVVPRHHGVAVVAVVGRGVAECLAECGVCAVCYCADWCLNECLDEGADAALPTGGYCYGHDKSKACERVRSEATNTRNNYTIIALLIERVKIE